MSYIETHFETPTRREEGLLLETFLGLALDPSVAIGNRLAFARELHARLWLAIDRDANKQGSR